MKKIYTLLAGLALTFASGTVMGQSFTTPDTVKIYTSGASDAHAPVNNLTPGGIALQWKVIATNMPADWLNEPVTGIGICDNKNCFGMSSLWPSGTTNTSDPYASGIHGDIKLSINLANVTSMGCYYMKVRMNVVGSPNDSSVTTFVFCKVGVSVPSVKAVDEMSLYPNPANNEINVVYDEAADVKSVGIYNIIGKLMTVYKVSGKSANLNIENIPAGIYFVRLLNGQGQVVVTRKFTKQ
jgi:hypothetical protein